MPKSSSKLATTTAPVAEEQDIFACECCEPKKNLVPRRDLGGLAPDGQHAQIALCVLHRPEISVYLWDETAQKYTWRKDLKFENNQVIDENGQIFARPQTPSTAVDLETDDSGGQSPRSGTRVDLERDDFYN
jgi:hypothetical protein